jgi:hypothetical protein
MSNPKLFQDAPRRKEPPYEQDSHPNWMPIQMLPLRNTATSRRPATASR